MRLSIFLFLLLFVPKANKHTLSPPAKIPRNVIIMIGDGMGLTQVTAGLYANKEQLNIARMPVTGLITTNAHKNLITDSAAGATAFACGCKTRNGVVGLDEKRNTCKNLFEQAKEREWATGVVVTSSITHATPAAFVAHVKKREEKEQIALDYLSSNIDLAIGGGRRAFEDREEDDRNLEEELQAKGYKVFNVYATPFEEVPFDPASPLIWFSANNEPPSVQLGRTYLSEATRKGITFLGSRSPFGFMMMVEGSQIDWAGHRNDAKWMVDETLDFDKAVGAALRFAEADGETLIIVTADHETGGAAIVQGSTTDSLNIKFVGGQHTSTMVPVFAYGPGSELFNGIYDNTDIYHKIKKALNWP